MAQDAFVQLIRYWDRVSRPDFPEAWLRRVAIRPAVQVARLELNLLARVVRFAPAVPETAPEPAAAA